MATMSPGYSSGRASIFREPHALHFMRLPIPIRVSRAAAAWLQGQCRAREYTHSSFPSWISWWPSSTP